MGTFDIGILLVNWRLQWMGSKIKVEEFHEEKGGDELCLEEIYDKEWPKSSLGGEFEYPLAPINWMLEKLLELLEKTIWR